MIYYNQDNIVRTISEKLEMDTKEVRNIFDCLGQVVCESLSSATLTEDVSLRFITGLTLYSKYVPGEEKISNLTKEKIVCKPRIMVKAKFSDRFKDKINNK